MRVVSLIASATEIVCALGREGDLVGRSHECDYPASVRSLPVCTAPRLDIHASSEDIDKSVKELLAQAESIYDVDAELLKSLRPDAIITQSHCDVCAVSDKDVSRAIFDWLEPRPTVVSLAPNALADIWFGFQEVADALDVPEAGRRLIESCRERMEAIQSNVSEWKRPTVACLEWLDPLMAAGNWMPELVEMAGGFNLFGEAGKHSPWMTWETLLEKDPDVVVAIPCGFDLERTLQEMMPLRQRPEWERLRAVREGRVYAGDGNQFFNRPGPRLVESLVILAEMFHPMFSRDAGAESGRVNAWARVRAPVPRRG